MQCTLKITRQLKQYPFNNTKSSSCVFNNAKVHMKKYVLQ